VTSAVSATPANTSEAQCADTAIRAQPTNARIASIALRVRG
jgi:hypothetical protein